MTKSFFRTQGFALSIFLVVFIFPSNTNYSIQEARYSLWTRNVILKSISYFIPADSTQGTNVTNSNFLVNGICSYKLFSVNCMVTRSRSLKLELTQITFIFHNSQLIDCIYEGSHFHCYVHFTIVVGEINSAYWHCCCLLFLTQSVLYKW